MWGQLPRVEALHASTLGYEIATPTELPRVRTIHNWLTIHDAWVRTIHNGLTIHDAWVRTIHNALTIHDAWVRTIHNKWRTTSSGNSVGVAVPQPRVAGEARYLGYIYNIKV